MMTDKQNEIAARTLCKFRGMNPDSLVAHDNMLHALYGQQVKATTRAWELVLPEIIKYQQIDFCIKSALAETDS
jgi:hypothetical protein